MNNALLLTSIAVGLLRFTVPGHGFSWPGTYEAFAHIWVGVLLVLSFQRAYWALPMLVILTLLETVCFLMR